MSALVPIRTNRDYYQAEGICPKPLPVSIPGDLIKVNYDAVVVTYPAGDTEVFTFKTGGTGGTTVATVTITYTDTTKDCISTVVLS